MREQAGPNEPEQANAALPDPIVIVETDAAQEGYDRRLATW